MKYFLLIFCLLLCSCPFENEELENLLFPSSSSVLRDEFPIPEPNPDTWPPDIEGIKCYEPLVEELSFGKQGGVRCVTGSCVGVAFPVYGEGKPKIVCNTEYICRTGGRTFKKLICPWFTATIIDYNTLHILVNQNETGKERETLVATLCGTCGNRIAITQSVD